MEATTYYFILADGGNYIYSKEREYKTLAAAKRAMLKAASALDLCYGYVHSNDQEAPVHTEGF